MATFADIWSSLQRPGKPLPFLLIDCAGIEEGQAGIPKHIFTEIECLFTGDLGSELADVGPYLGRLKSLSPEVAKAVEDLLARQVGMLVEPNPDAPENKGLKFAQLHQHFRKFNVVTGPEGNKIFFRYYDPRVIADVFKVLGEQQISDFYGPVISFVVLDKFIPENIGYRTYKKPQGTAELRHRA